MSCKKIAKHFLGLVWRPLEKSGGFFIASVSVHFVWESILITFASMPSISIILPVFKQSKQVDKIHDIYTRIAQKFTDVVEVIIVANNNDLDTFKAFQQIESDLFKVFLVEAGGWGEGLKFGVEKAMGKWVLYTNSARTHFEELDRFLNSSDLNLSSIFKAKRQTRGLVRKLLSKLFELEFQLFSGYKQTDVNGTPKLLQKDLFNEFELSDSGVFIDSELVFKAHQKGIEFIDLPFFNYKRLEGKSTTNTKMAIAFLLQLPAKIKSWK